MGRNNGRYCSSLQTLKDALFLRETGEYDTTLPYHPIEAIGCSYSPLSPTQREALALVLKESGRSMKGSLVFHDSRSQRVIVTNDDGGFKCWINSKGERVI